MRLVEKLGCMGVLLVFHLKQFGRAHSCQRLLLHFFLTDHGIGMEIHSRAHQNTEDNLSDQLLSRRKTFLVLFENLDVIIRKAEHSQPNRGEQHQNDIDIGDIAEQQSWNQNGRDDDETAHSRRTRLFVLSS